ncbi:MAG: hypothetical protein EB060_01990 [Proteobacteria bacterium]|nr:hypothetical protein [Pseudomonadota bacterium]
MGTFMKRLRYYVPNVPTGFILLIGILIAYTGITPILNPEFYDDGVDSSWMWVMCEAFVHHMKWGKDILWHYGPLGFLYGRGYNPDTFLLKNICWFYMVTVYVAGCYTLVMRSGERTTPHLVAIPMLMLFAAISYETAFLSFPVLFLVYSFFMRARQSKLLLYLLVGGMVISSLTKISYMMLSLVILLLVESFRMICLKERPYYIVAYVVGWLVGWKLCHQDFTLIPAYIHGAMQHAHGFAESMQLDITASLHYPLFVGGLVIIWALMASIWFPQFGKEAWVPLLGIAYIFFAATKIGFIHNNNYHILEASAVFILVALTTRDLFWEDLSERKQYIFMFYCMGVAIFITLMSMSQEGADDRKELKKMFSDVDPKNPLSGKSNEAHFKEALEKIRSENPLPQVKGTSDMLAASQAVLLAHHLAYKPRPIFQGYHVFTSYLAEKNKAFLESDQAPDNLFFKISQVTKRYTSIEDAVSWPVILTHYDPQKFYGTGLEHRVLHLTKRDKPVTYSFKTIRQVTAKWRDKVDVPSVKKYGLVWVRIHVEPTLLHRIVTTFYRAARVMMEVETADGKKQNAILMYGTLEDGFLISPEIKTADDFKALYGKDPVPPARDVVSISLFEKGLKMYAHHLFEPKVEYTFEQVVIHR